MNQDKIRNFCVIAHIDHGKSTLCDRMLEITHTLEKREIREQALDQMDLERERGITIKLQPVKMKYQHKGVDYELNLIDTPGHVDFSYEVSRSLAAVEGVILLIDATQGIQAQTLANLYLALAEDLIIIPAINKIDLPNAQIEETKKAIRELIGCKEEEILEVSGKTGQGVSDILATIIEKVPAPQGESLSQPQALIFDSYWDPFKGVVVYVRIKNGSFRKGDEIYVINTRNRGEVVELGIFTPKLISQEILTTGQIGYIATGMKSINECRVGDTITLFEKKETVKALQGYRKVNPLVFASFYPKEGNDYSRLRDALEKLSLNDASFSYKGESSQALGRGFRGGFLGLLHMEIIQERLRREFDLDLIFSTPSVKYKVKLKGGKNELVINSPAELPDASSIAEILEPWVKLEIVTASLFIGSIMEYMSQNRSRYLSTNYLDEKKVILNYEAPLSEVITNLHDSIKTISKGYASINYELSSFEPSQLVRLDIFIAGELKEELSRIVPTSRTRKIGLALLKKLKDNLEKQNFPIALQAAVGGKIIARENIKALRKDVLAKLYGGDRTRKDKLLKKQKKGKKLLTEKGRVTIPPKVYIEIIKG